MNAPQKTMVLKRSAMWTKNRLMRSLHDGVTTAGLRTVRTECCEQRCLIDAAVLILVAHKNVGDVVRPRHLGPFREAAHEVLCGLNQKLGARVAVGTIQDALQLLSAKAHLRTAGLGSLLTRGIFVLCLPTKQEWSTNRLRGTDAKCAGGKLCKRATDRLVGAAEIVVHGGITSRPDSEVEIEHDRVSDAISVVKLCQCTTAKLLADGSIGTERIVKERLGSRDQGNKTKPNRHGFNWS